MAEDSKKKIDESWKGRIEKEKKEAENQQQTYHEPTLSIFLSSLGMQAMIALGKLENPLTKKAEKNIEQARYLIDTLGILKEKTKGNLTAEEEKLLDESLYNLRLLYVNEKEPV